VARTSLIIDATPDVWKRHLMALDEIDLRLERIAASMEQTGVPFAFVGGQAVAMWVATIDPAAIRTTKDVDILIRRADLPQARKAALAAGMDYFEVLGVGMFLEQSDPNPRHAVHLIWASEKVRPEYPLPSPGIDERERLGTNRPVVSLSGLVRMKLMANREHDRTHLRDMIDVGLVTREMSSGLPAELATRLDQLLTEQGR
jgi:hypothetical protein